MARNTIERGARWEVRPGVETFSCTPGREPEKTHLWPHLRSTRCYAGFKQDGVFVRLLIWRTSTTVICVSSRFLVSSMQISGHPILLLEMY